MATTAVQSRTAANIVVPSIHLGSFSPYPKMSTDYKHPIRLPEENTVPVLRDDKPSSYRNSQRHPNTLSYPSHQSFSYSSSFPQSRGPYNPIATMPRTPSPRNPTPSGLYSNVLQPLPVQPPNSPAQLAGPPREVCLECMMRDEDMADVDVTSPGIWDRQSDVYYHDLCAREQEEERERDLNGHPSNSSAASSSNGDSRPRAHGLSLTEGNLKIWLTLNPREPAAKQQTLHTYLDSQNALLAAEARARIKAIRESRLLDDKMRDTYSQLRRSAYDLGATASPFDDAGVKIRSPSMDDVKKRDTTLLENGMIVERVDMRKEEARVRARARKASRDSLGVVDNRERDATSLYSFQAAEGAASLRVPAPHESTVSVPASRSVRSMYTTPSSSWQQQLPNRPMSLAPTSRSVPVSASQTSLESGSPRRRFFGLRHHLSGYFGSSTSLAPSGSMMDMHLGLDQEKHLAQIPHVDIGSSSPSLGETWLHKEDAKIPELGGASSVKKKKRRGLSRLWKFFSGAPTKAEHYHHHRADHHVVPAMAAGVNDEDDDEDQLPLAPPPPLSYLVNRSNGGGGGGGGSGGGGSGNAPSERSMNNNMRHLSMPSLTSLNGTNHPRSSSAPSGVGLTFSSPSEKSSTLPSPVEVRFPYRDSSGDEPEDEDPAAVGEKKAAVAGGGGSSPKRAFNVSEPDMRRPSPSPPILPIPVSVSVVRNTTATTTNTTTTAASTGPPSTASSLTPTLKRPGSLLSLDKSLPPLPLGEYELSPDPNEPQALFPPNSTFPHNEFASPATSEFPHHQPQLLLDAGRRQSFGGLTSPSPPSLSPSLSPSLLPASLSRRTGMEATTAAPYFDDFAAGSQSHQSRHSLVGGGVEPAAAAAVMYPHSPHHPALALAPAPVPVQNGKRRSRFGFGALLGRKSGEKRRGTGTGGGVGAGVGVGMGMGQDDGGGVYAHGGSVASMSMSISERSSVHGRTLDELVPRDLDFVAYRYPSRDERLDLSRG